MFPSLLFEMIISTGSKGAFVLCQLSRTIIILESLSLLFVAGFVIFDSLLRSPSSSPHWFQCHTFGMCAKYFHQRLRGSDHPGGLLGSSHKQRSGIHWAQLSSSGNVRGSSGQGSVTDNVSAIWDILRMWLQDKSFSWMRKNRNGKQKEQRNCSSILATY